MRQRYVLLAATVLAFTTVGAGASFAHPVARRASTVKVVASDFKFAVSRATAKRGSVTFVIHNVGTAPHDFAIAGHRSKIVGPGKTTRLRVALTPGRYAYKCTVDSHAELGMKGVFRVRPGS